MAKGKRDTLSDCPSYIHLMLLECGRILLHLNSCSRLTKRRLPTSVRLFDYIHTFNYCVYVAGTDLLRESGDRVRWSTTTAYVYPRDTCCLQLSVPLSLSKLLLTQLCESASGIWLSTSVNPPLEECTCLSTRRSNVLFPPYIHLIFFH